LEARPKRESLWSFQPAFVLTQALDCTVNQDYHPTLLTPDKNAPQGYQTQWMNPGTEPRLYHNNALLLPDARVWVLGGQGGYAGWDNRNGSITPPVDQAKPVRLDIKAGTGDLAEKGQNFFSAETWQPEIFNPPYLFIDGTRPDMAEMPLPRMKMYFPTPHSPLPIFHGC
jgi:hypothetical protein